MKFLFRSMMLNKHLARGFPAQFFTRHMEGSLLLPGITETPTARSAWVDTNPVFLSLRQGYSTGDCQSSNEVGSEKTNKQTTKQKTNKHNQNKKTQKKKKKTKTKTTPKKPRNNSHSPPLPACVPLGSPLTQTCAGP